MAKRELEITISASLLMLVLLSWQTLVSPFDTSLILPMLLFGGLVLFSLSFGVIWVGGLTSTLPVITAVSFLVLGILPTAWVILVSSSLHGIVRYRFRRELRLAQVLTWVQVLSRTAVNIFNNTLSMAVGGWVFLQIEPDPLGDTFSLTWIIALVFFAIAYFTVNYTIIILYYRFFVPSQASSFFQQIPFLLLYEGAPFIFIPFITDVYTQLGLSHFAFLSLIVMGFSLITHNLDRTRQGLEFRIQELDGLQSVGQALGVSLELDKVLQAIYQQVRRFMPADTFYVALYDNELGQITFPFFVQEGEQIVFPSRRPANGLTEHILRTRQPLLVPQNVEEKLAELKLEPIGVLASSCLSVPILAGNRALGVMSVQSLQQQGIHTRAHQRLLETVATQAALAIQNARLYAQIRSSLARRVQELNSIFRTTQDGILLLGRDWEMLAINRAFSGYVGLIGLEPNGQSARTWPADGGTLLMRLGYTAETFFQDCQQLLQDGEGAQMKKQIIISGQPDRYAERVVTAVYDDDRSQVMGWLIILRDVTEEVELSRLREEMTHMLVHDLRSPLSIMLNTLEIGRLQIAEGDMGHLPTVLTMAEKNGQRMLRLINDLLDIYKLENENVPLKLQWVPVKLLLEDVVAQFNAVAQEAGMEMRVDVMEGAPPLYVDYEYVVRLVYNLVDNAVKFTPDNGRIRVWALLDKGTEPHTMLLGVTDTGSGIPASARVGLFEKFKYGHVAGRRSGTGLGLPYCKLVAEAHGGEIWVESTGQPGQGSTFVVRLPVVEGSDLSSSPRKGGDK